MGAKNENFEKSKFFVTKVLRKKITVLDVSFGAEQIFQVTFFQKMTSSPQKMEKTENLRVFKGSLTILNPYSKTEDK